MHLERAISLKLEQYFLSNSRFLIVELIKPREIGWSIVIGCFSYLTGHLKVTRCGLLVPCAVNYGGSEDINEKLMLRGR